MDRKSRNIKIATVLCCAAAAVFICVQLFNIAAQPYSTQTATRQTVLSTVDVELFVLRDESLLMGEGGYTVVPLAANAERIAKGSTVAAYFTSGEAANNYVNSSRIKDKLESYKTIDKQLSLANVDMDKLSESVDGAFNDIVNSAYLDDYSALADIKLDFLERLSLKQISLGKSIDCSAKIASLEGQLAALESSAVPEKIVTADRSGYFVSELDGYENAIPFDTYKNASIESIEAALKSEKAPAPAGCLGKVIAGYDWYLLGVLDTVSATALKKGSTVKLIIGASSEDSLEVTVNSVSDVSDGKAAVVFKCKRMNEQLATMRKVNAKVVFAELTGLKVDKQAIRVNAEGENGVYVIRGNIVSYRSLNVVYSEDTFVIAKAPDSGSDIELSAPHLKLYDEIVISGKDLRDGMVIN